MTWVYCYYWPLPLLKYRKRPSMSAMLRMKNNKSNFISLQLVLVWSLSNKEDSQILYWHVSPVPNTNFAFLDFSLKDLIEQPLLRSTTFCWSVEILKLEAIRNRYMYDFQCSFVLFLLPIVFDIRILITPLASLNSSWHK
jgi:hypothetical protein